MAPFIAGLLASGLRLVANAALVKGKDFIKEKTGVDLEEGNAILSEGDIAKLREFEFEHEEELLRLQLEDNKLGIEETKLYLADVQDARNQQSAVLMSEKAPWYAKAIQPALGVLVVCATIILFALFVYWSGDVPLLDQGGKPLLDNAGKAIMGSKINSTQKDIIIYILGVLSAAVTQILGYYFGSSSGSKIKTDALNDELAKRTKKEVP
ncbi:MAG: hypothetical protein AB7F61_16060 [Desulfobulbus sp.]